jgi:hypothetical protein
VDSASFSTRIQLKGGGAELGELGRYGLSNPELMAPEDPEAKAASPRAALPKTPTLVIPVLAVPCGVPRRADTYVANATIGRRWTTGANKVRLLSSEHHESPLISPRGVNRRF